ncbi:hypothetical protein AYI68_g3127 [Smittium mucronatum]|uniref:Uncharacterized protein n=1 Tax=Smittium mucronatum TaxID=133383 RepID=A0A1R0H0U9_9FUNG|nr:hypothetical protein AYI68_g3127 [Smittium mucronatum]
MGLSDIPFLYRFSLAFIVTIRGVYTSISCKKKSPYFQPASPDPTRPDPHSLQIANSYTEHSELRANSFHA